MLYTLPTVTRTAPGRVCAYCGEETLTGSERPEHPLPAALGSSLEVATVCDPCNTWAGKHVDQPFLADDWLRVTWAEFDLPNERRRGRGRVASPLRHGFTPEGVRVIADENWKPRLGARILEDPGTGETHIHAGSSGEAERLIERVRERAAREGKEIVITSRLESQIQPVVNSTIKVGIAVWRQMAAKIALGCASVAYPEDWRRSDEAAKLREWMRDKNLPGPDGNPLGLLPALIDETHVYRKLVEPPEHLVCFAPTYPASPLPAMLAVVLFGTLFFQIPVPYPDHPSPTIGWRLDPRSAADSVETTWEGLMYRMFERSDAEESHHN
jgi:hypothetical protein